MSVTALGPRNRKPGQHQQQHHRQQNCRGQQRANPRHPGGTNDNANGTAVSFLNLGTGTNVINVNNIVMPRTKRQGLFNSKAR